MSISPGIQNVLIVRGAWSELYEPAWNRTLGELGVTSRIFDTHAHFAPGVLGRVEQRLLWGSDVRKVNRKLLDTVKDTNPEVVLLYQGHHYWPETIRRLRHHTLVVGYHNDDLLGPRQSMLRYRHLNRALPEYHGYHVYRECNVQSLSEIGVAHATVLMSYYIPWLDHPYKISCEEQRRFDCDLVFIGHWENDGRAQYLASTARRGLRTRVYGQARYWKHAMENQRDEMLELQQPVHGIEYRKALQGAKIATCFLSKWNRDQYTRRVFEIPACGVFLLAERTPLMQQLYDEGKEAEFFDCQEEFVEKAQFYLQHASARKQIAEKGYRRATRSGYDIHSRMRQWLNDVGQWQRELSPRDISAA